MNSWVTYFIPTVVFLVALLNGMAAGYLLITRIEEFQNHMAWYRNRYWQFYYRDPAGRTVRDMAIAAVFLLIGSICYMWLYGELREDVVLRWMFHGFNLAIWGLFFVQLALSVSMWIMVRRARRELSTPVS